MDKLVFYNAYGNGDIFESREFVREIYEYIEPKECYYAHGKHPDILRDMDFIHSIPFCEASMNSRSPFMVSNGRLYINTWIGRDSKYVLPGIGCVVEELYKMYNETLKKMSAHKLKKSPLEYVPRINFTAYDIGKIDLFLAGRRDKKKVLISNGPVQSSQAENFDFTPVIERLVKDYPDVIFITTERTNILADNIFYTGNIIEKHGFDLNEIAYLSMACSLIVGRNSGPHVFSQHLDNWEDERKVCLSFTYKQVASHFVLSNDFPMRKEWSPETSVEGVYNKIKGLL